MKIDSLYLFPVKSLQGHITDSLSLDRYGAVDDRRWMLVDAENRFVTQRRIRHMAQLRATVTPTGVRIQHRDGDEIEITQPGESAPALRVTVWDDAVLARDAGDMAAHWLSERLQTSVRLVAMGAEFHRPLAAPRADRQVGFADAAPLLVISQASLDDLNARLAEPVSMLNFRPNLVVSDCEPFAEDQWTRMIVHTRDGPAAFECTHPCARCAIPGLDPLTGEVRREPLRTLARYRRGEDGQVYFGVNLAPISGATATGTINLGDRVEAI